jgi:hypothetical protein
VTRLRAFGASARHAHCRALFTIVLIGGLALESTSAQSLGELARREEERRRQITPGKQYTNADLPQTQSATAPAVTQPDSGPAAPAIDPQPAKAADAHEETAPARGREKRDETYWRARARELGGHVQRTQTEIGSLEARLAELETQAATSPDARRERDVTAAQLRKLRQNLLSFTKEVERFEQRARADRVPADWIK